MSAFKWSTLSKKKKLTFFYDERNIVLFIKNGKNADGCN